MSVFVKGMKMPSGCFDCHLSVEDYEGYWCCIVPKCIGWELERPSWCPLTEMKDDHYYIMKDGILYEAKVATPEEMGAKTFNVKEYIENG